MRNEGAVHGEKPQPINPTLSEQHPVELIARLRLRLDGSKRVTLVDPNDLYAHVADERRQGAEGRRQPKFAQSPFDGDFPKARRAQVVLAIAVGRELKDGVRQASRAALD
jgi:hypothetical protein